MHEYRNKRAPIDHMIDLENMREMEEAPPYSSTKDTGKQHHITTYLGVDFTLRKIQCETDLSGSTPFLLLFPRL